MSTIAPQSIPLLALPSLPLDARKSLPNCAAIYFVLTAVGEVVYIGQTRSLVLRWMSHKLERFAEYHAHRVAWLVMDDVAVLREVEAACIAYFAPRGNGPLGGRRQQPERTWREKRWFLRMPEPMLDACRKRATAQRRSLNAQLLCVIEAWLQTEERQEGAKYVYQPGQRA